MGWINFVEETLWTLLSVGKIFQTGVHAEHTLFNNPESGRYLQPTGPETKGHKQHFRQDRRSDIISEMIKRQGHGLQPILETPGYVFA